MATTKVKLGNVEIISLSDGNFEFPLQNMFPTVPAESWAPYKDMLGGNGTTVRVNVGAFAIRTGSQTVMIDTGMSEAPYAEMGWPGGKLMGDLQSNGIKPEEVGMVLFTHLHADHCGWNFRQVDGEMKLTFPNARFFIQQTEWEYYTRPEVIEQNPYIRFNVLPLQEMGKLEIVPGEKAITSELTMIPTPGHTPGHASVLIASGGELGAILGDVAHHYAQAHEVDWSPGFDSDPDVSRQTRRRIFDRLEKEGRVIGAGHFLPQGFGKLVRAEGGKRTFRLV